MIKKSEQIKEINNYSIRKFIFLLIAVFVFSSQFGCTDNNTNNSKAQDSHHLANWKSLWLKLPATVISNKVWIIDEFSQCDDLEKYKHNGTYYSNCPKTYTASLMVNGKSQNIDCTPQSNYGVKDIESLTISELENKNIQLFYGGTTLGANDENKIIEVTEYDITSVNNEQ